MDLKSFLGDLETYGVGKRKLDDPLFDEDDHPKRFGICDVDDEALCHEVIQTVCQIPGCTFEADTLLEFENHYNASHRYSCSICKKVLPSPHLLDLHLQEKHDSFFAVVAAKKPSYCCYIEECGEKFLNPEDRTQHCIKIHKLPKDFRFDQKPKKSNFNKAKTKNSVKERSQTSMETDTNSKETQFYFKNSNTVTFAKKSSKKRNDLNETASSSSVDVCMEELQDEFQSSNLFS